MTTEKIFNNHARENLSDGGVDRTFNGGLQIAKKHVIARIMARMGLKKQSMAAEHFHQIGH